MSWLTAIVALCVVIIIHELGHYLCALATGMRVDRFSVFGIGPALVRLGTWRGTEFIIGAIPFGAYVIIRGMEPEDDVVEDKDTKATEPIPPATKVPAAESANFRDKPLWARALVLAGGPLANYITASVILFGVYVGAGVKGPPEAVEISAVNQDSAAMQAGLLPGDELVQIANQKIDPETGLATIHATTAQNVGQTIPVTFLRDGQKHTVPVTLADAKQPLGVGLELRAPRVAIGVGAAASRALVEPYVISGKQIVGLYQLATGQLEAQMQGPIGIVKHMARSAELGWVSMLTTTALISTLLGMFNLLPMPALDGGRLMFLGYEAITRRPANSRVEGWVHGIGMLALLLLLVIISIGDIRGS